MLSEVQGRGCLILFENVTQEILSRIFDFAHFCQRFSMYKKVKIKSSNLWHKVPLFFWCDLFAETRADSLKNVFRDIWKHHKDISKLTDLYKSWRTGFRFIFLNMESFRKFFVLPVFKGFLKTDVIDSFDYWLRTPIYLLYVNIEYSSVL